jgi:GWxTD domain-containing protein
LAEAREGAVYVINGKTDIVEAQMKKPIMWTILVLAGLVFLAPTSASAKKEADKYEKWLKEEVALIVLPEEKAEFEGLKTDADRDRFIELFWAKRDPSPGSRINEFRDEWMARLEHVNKTYAAGVGPKGWRSDMGKVYLIFGPPAQVQSGGGGARPASTGGTQMEAPAETWQYQPMPDLSLTDAFQVVFRNYQFGYELDQGTPQKIRRAMEVFPKVVVFNPDLKELPMYKYVLDENSPEGKMIRDFIETGTEIKGLSLEWAPIYTRAMGGSTYVSLLVQVDPGTIDRKKLKETTFFGRLKGGSEDVQDFLKTVRVEKEKADKLVMVFGFPAKPGKSVLYLGAEDKDKENPTLIKADLDVKDFWTGDLDTSSLIFSSEVVSRPKDEAEGEFSPYVMSDYRATPRWGSVFKASEDLSVLFHIYNAATENGEVNLIVDYFIISPEVGYRLNPQTIRAKVEENKAVAGGTQVPLSPLKPGKYTFKIKVTDKVANKVIERTAEFAVE